MGNQTILWIDEIAFGRIEDSPTSLKLFIRDKDGSHLSVWKKDDECWGRSFNIAISADRYSWPN